MSLLGNHNSEFEKKLKKQLGDLEQKPSESLWDRIDKEVNRPDFEGKVEGKIGQYEVTPKPETWTYIEEQLPPEPSRWKRTGRIWYGMALLLFMGGTLIGYQLSKLPGQEIAGASTVIVEGSAPDSPGNTRIIEGSGSSVDLTIPDGQEIPYQADADKIAAENQHAGHMASEKAGNDPAAKIEPETTTAGTSGPESANTKNNRLAGTSVPGANNPVPSGKEQLSRTDKPAAKARNTSPDVVSPRTRISRSSAKASATIASKPLAPAAKKVPSPATAATTARPETQAKQAIVENRQTPAAAMNPRAQTTASFQKEPVGTASPRTALTAPGTQARTTQPAAGITLAPSTSESSKGDGFVTRETEAGDQNRSNITQAIGQSSAAGKQPVERKSDALSVNDVSTPVNKTSSSVSLPDSGRALSEDSAKAVPENGKPMAPVTDPVVHTSPEQLLIEPELPTRLSISIMAGLHQGNMKLEAPAGRNLEENTILRRKTEMPKIDFTGSFLLDYKISDHILISSGVMFTSLSMGMKYDIAPASREATPRPGATYTNTSDSIMQGSGQNHRIHYSWNEVPLFITVRSNPEKRLGIEVKSGISYAILSTIDAAMTGQDNVGVLLLKNKESFPYMKNSWFAHLYAGVTYRVNPTVTLQLMPYFKYSLSNMIDNDNWVRQYPWMRGVSIGLRKGF